MGCALGFAAQGDVRVQRSKGKSVSRMLEQFGVLCMTVVLGRGDLNLHEGGCSGVPKALATPQLLVSLMTIDEFESITPK